MGCCVFIQITHTKSERIRAIRIINENTKKLIYYVIGEIFEVHLFVIK